jgi:D-alanine-D-alanine ligase
VANPIGSDQEGTRHDTTFTKHKDKYLIWVVAPYLETEDPNLKYYYDYTQSIAEYEKVFSDVGCEWKWVNMTFDTIEKVIRDIKHHPSVKTPIVINLCDGDESNGIPGISVIQTLERYGIAYTGANEHFYRITTSKIPMKEAFDVHGVQTPRWRVVQASTGGSDKLFRDIGEVLIVKPAISAGSMGLSIRNVVSNQGELDVILQQMELGYRGWKLDTGGIFVEQFINGREFTTLVVGSSSDPATLKVYPPAERVFNVALPDKERFLSFDRLWETYDDESPLPDKGLLYNYYEPEIELVSQLKQISIDAFKSVGGMGYGRLDIRMDARNGQLYMLEVNAQCGLSEDENYTSIGAILRFAKKSFTYLIIEIVEDALMRYGAKHKALQ